MPESREDKLIRELLANVKPPADDYPNWRRGLRWGISGAVIGTILGFLGTFVGTLGASLIGKSAASISYGYVIGTAFAAFLLVGAIGAFRPPRER